MLGLLSVNWPSDFTAIGLELNGDQGVIGGPANWIPHARLSYSDIKATSMDVYLTSLYTVMVF